MTKLIKSVINKINERKIKPIPRWHFVILHILLWSAFILAIIFGAIALSVIFSFIDGAEWEIARRAGRGSVRGFFLVLPYLWLTALGIVLYLASKLFEKTGRGYIYTRTIIVLSSVVISLIIGTVFYFAGVGYSVEKNLVWHVPPYAQWSERRDRGMVAPDEGVLIGKVINIDRQKELIIIDFKNFRWTVDISEAVFKNDFEPQIGYPVGIIGEKTGNGMFKADTILPWRPNSQMPPHPKKMIPPVLPLS